MSKIRVYELAKEVGRESKELLKFLAEQGIFVRSASSTLGPVEVRRVREALARATPVATPEQPPMRGYAVEKLRVHELAAELGIEPSELLPVLANEGQPVSSTFDPLSPRSSEDSDHPGENGERSIVLETRMSTSPSPERLRRT